MRIFEFIATLVVLSVLLGVTCAGLFQAARYCSCAVKSNAKKRVRTLPQVTHLIFSTSLLPEILRGTC